MKDNLEKQQPSSCISIKALVKVGWFMVIFALLLVGRIAYIQQAKGGAYTAMAQSQRLKTIEVSQYSRGNFLDCKGRKLTNKAESVLVVYPSILKKYPESLVLFEQIIDSCSFQEANQLFFSSQILPQQLAGDKPFLYGRNFTKKQLSLLEPIINKEIEGVYLLELEPRYMGASFANHIIGFMGEADEMDLQYLKASGLNDIKYVGKAGLEKKYDEYLRGKSSAKIGVLVDEPGRQISNDLRYLEAGSNQSVISKDKKNQGFDVALTIDYDYQEIAEKAISGRDGAVVVIDVNNGNVLAMASAPSFNPYLGQPDTQGDVYLNKALAFYPPASVYKMVLALAALDTGYACPENFVCNGYYTLPNGHKVSCWYHQGHGKEDLTKALGNSCNPYFINLGLGLSGDVIKEYTYRLGLTKQQLIGYDAPSLENNLDFNSKVPGDVANVSIGEKGIRLTPLMVAQLTALVANGGELVIPKLVEGIIDENGKLCVTYESSVPRQVVKRESALALQRILADAVQYGTGTPVLNNIVSAGGKSGTTQHQGVWFSGFAPVNQPKVAIAVYLADGNSGGKDGGTVFREIIEGIAILDGFSE